MRDLAELDFEIIRIRGVQVQAAGLLGNALHNGASIFIAGVPSSIFQFGIADAEDDDSGALGGLNGVEQVAGAGAVLAVGKDDEGAALVRMSSVEWMMAS